mmetsp:Transcript_2695/g.5604  ORF Transcript_2695/g.5604 Transcript_2695/m.5604 type:complete len:422 (-) Transcript_2695:187-1452(-)
MFITMVQPQSCHSIQSFFLHLPSIILVLFVVACKTPTSLSFRPISLPTRHFSHRNHHLQPQGTHHYYPFSLQHHSHRSQNNQPQRMGSALSSSTSSSFTKSKDPHPLTPTTKATYRNKSILLTGASRGLGRSLARQLSKCGPSVLILSGRDEVALEEVKLECLQIYREECKNADDFSNDGDGDAAKTMKVCTIKCDLGDRSSVEQLATQALQLSSNGIIDVLINNGGVSSRSSFLDTKLEVDEKIMQVNFFSGVALAKRLVPRMVALKEGGDEREKEMTKKIIWISSVQGKLGTPYRTSYAASKFAVQGYCEALRSELATSNVSVHVVSPGYIRTNLSLSAVMGDGRAYSKMDETTANGADPEEVAATVLNSVSDGKTDFVVAATFSAKAALWLKFFVPSFLENMLVKRFEKGKIETKKEV